MIMYCLNIYKKNLAYIENNNKHRYKLCLKKDLAAGQSPAVGHGYSSRYTNDQSRNERYRIKDYSSKHYEIHISYLIIWHRCLSVQLRIFYWL